jgi:predicted O-methyltransferase YrrM
LVSSHRRLRSSNKKVKAAQEIWTEAGNEVQEIIISSQGDLPEILAEETVLPHEMDVLFLDGNLSRLSHSYVRAEIQ